MKETLERVAEAASALAGSFRELSSGRKAAILVVVVLLAGTASTLLLPGGGASPRRILNDPPGGQENGAPPDRSPYESSSLFDTPGRLLGKQREYNREKIEQAIGLNRNIARAHIVLSHAPVARQGAGALEEDSAAVSIHLHPGVQELLPQEAEAIRSLVSSAFNLKPERVSITDDKLRSYNDRSGGASSLASARQKEIGGVIAERYARLFAPGEFHVSVIVQLSTHQSSIVKEDVDPEPVSGPRVTRIEREECPPVDPGADGGIGSPSSNPWRRYRETNEEETRFGSKKTLTEIPPGELEGVSASVLIDLGAAERHLRKEGLLRPPPGRDGDLSLAMLPPADRELLLKDFAGREEDALRSMLRPLAGARAPEPSVKVMVHPFERALAAAAEPDLAGLAPVPQTPGGWTGGAVLAAAGAAVILAWTLLVVRKRGVPKAADLAGDWAGREALRDGARARHATRASLAGGLLRSVGDASALVRERPEVAALVLRSWLAQDGEGAREGAKR